MSTIASLVICVSIIAGIVTTLVVAGTMAIVLVASIVKKSPCDCMIP